jgi:TRAP-type C4-dicarboxylate transport system permease small subunit
MKRFLHALDENAERWFMLVAYTFVCFVIVQEVLRRFVLNYSSAWAEETARYAFIYLGWVGAAYAVKERAHVRFDLVLHAIPERLRGWIYIAGECCTMLFALIALWYSMHSIDQLIHFDAATPVLRINKAWVEAAVPVGFTLVIWRSLQAIRRDWSDLQAGRTAWVGKAMFEE